MDLQINGKTALITGGSDGLGLGVALALAAEGVRVAIASRSNAKLEAALEKLPSDTLAFNVDLSSAEHGTELVNEVKSKLGRIDILVANAGGPRSGGFASVAMEDYRAAIEQNLLAMIALCTEVVPDMARAHFGRIIAITSLWVKEPSPGLILSNTARSGLTAFLKSLSTQVAPDGITVNSILPGYHRTSRLIQLSGGNLEPLVAAVPAGDIGDPESFGKIAAFVASRHAWYMTGQAIVVDGGVLKGIF